MALNQGRKNELSRLVKEAIVQCKLAGLNPAIDAFNMIKKAMKATGRQLSKEELEWIKAEIDLQMGVEEAIIVEPKEGSADAEKAAGSEGIKASEFVNASEAGAAKTAGTENKEETKFDFKNFVNFDKTTGKFSIQLPKEDEVEDLINQIFNKKETGLKAAATVASNVIKAGVTAGIGAAVANTYKKTSMTYAEKGELSASEKRQIESFARAANSILSAFLK